MHLVPRPGIQRRLTELTDLQWIPWHYLPLFPHRRCIDTCNCRCPVGQYQHLSRQTKCLEESCPNRSNSEQRTGYGYRMIKGGGNFSFQALGQVKYSSGYISRYVHWGNKEPLLKIGQNVRHVITFLALWVVAACPTAPGRSRHVEPGV